MLEVRSVVKTYSDTNATVHAIDSIDLSIRKGDFVVIHGSSGSGKTTLLLMIGGMLRPTSGAVVFRGDDIYSLSSKRRGHYRRDCVGFVFQKFFLLPYLTAYDNIRLALPSNRSLDKQHERILEVAARFGMTDRLDHRPSQLSVGEQQRIAMARTIAAEPEILLADEPTGNLDRTNSDTFAEFLTEENQRGRTVVLVTHDERWFDLGNRRIHLDAGRLTQPNVKLPASTNMATPTSDDAYLSDAGDSPSS
jgi:putative ABC transport system ATP-binding protein